MTPSVPLPPQGHTRDLCMTGSPAVLLVDDERAFADALAFRLQTRGVAVSTAYRGEEAIEQLAQPFLEVVLLDLNMPGPHGLDVLCQIKERRPDVEVILLTGEADFSLAAKGMRRGAGDYLLKPVDFDVLLESLRKARQRAGEHRERLRAAEAGKLMALGALAAGVGHEINNPLQIIMHRSEWLQELAEDASRGRPDYGEMAKTAEVIQRQAERAGAITARLLDLAHKSRSGAVTTDLPELVERVTKRLRPRAESLGAELVTALAADLAPLSCSPAELEPVLTHLLTNALDAVEARLTSAAPPVPKQPGSPPPVSPFVRLAAERRDDRVRISVEDTGEGVAPEAAPHIFEPFFSTRPVGGGTGLGLTVCHSIITALRGELRFYPAPDPPGGAVFTVDIPSASEETG